MKNTHAAVSNKGNPLKKYQQVVVGSPSLLYTIYFEFCLLLAIIPGALGLYLRKIFWPRLFASCGKNVMFAANVIIRHPHRIQLGNNIVFSEGCILDARNEESEKAIVINDDVIFSNNVMLSCKNGEIVIGSRTGINAQTIIQSTNQCQVVVGPDVIIGQQCFIVAGGNYNTDRLDIPIRLQGIKKDQGIMIEEDVWLGGKVTVLGGVRMGKGSIAAAGAVVTRSVAALAVCKGVPAKTFKMRNHPGQAATA